MNQERIGNFIAKLRKEKKMTQQELAIRLNVTDKAVSKWENGRCLMDISLLKPLSECLGVSIVELINGERIAENDVSNKSNEIVHKTLDYATTKIKKNKFKIIIGTIVSMALIFSLVFIAYKTVLLELHKVDSENFNEVVSGLKVKNTLSIYKRTLPNNDYLIVDDIKLRNDFQDFLREDVSGTTTFKKELDNGEKVGFSISVGDSYVNYFSTTEAVVFRDITDKNNKTSFDFGQFNAADKKYFLFKNEIDDDRDFLEYIYKTGYKKSNIFMSDREIKENYAYNLFVDVAIPRVNSITLIKGDYVGYIYNINEDKVIRNVCILRNDKVYSFIFLGEQFNDEYLNDLLSTLEIK